VFFVYEKKNTKYPQLLWDFGGYFFFPTGRGLVWFFAVDNTRSTEQAAEGRDPVLGTQF
jgi:hypothetical protein